MRQHGEEFVLPPLCLLRRFILFFGRQGRDDQALIGFPHVCVPLLGVGLRAGDGALRFLAARNSFFAQANCRLALGIRTLALPQRLGAIACRELY
jgi:hypothetical protein